MNGDLLEDLEDAADTDEETGMPELDEYSTPETFDEYLTASVMLPRGGEVLKAQGVARKRDVNGNPIGKANSNPILDTREYIVEFEDGATDVYSANMIAENMYAQIDNEGKTFALMSEIVDHKSDARAMKVADDTGRWDTKVLRQIRIYG